MDILAKIKERNTLITIGILLILSLLVLYMRVLPLLNLGTTDILNIVGADDPQYNLRLIEMMMNHYPSYSLFAPDVLVAQFEFASCPLTWRHRIWGAEEYAPEVANGILLRREGDDLVTDHLWVTIPRGQSGERRVNEAKADMGLLCMAEFL